MQPPNSGIQRRSGTLLEMRYVICVCVCVATHSILRIINPRCVHARSEGYCSCPVCVCVYVCVCVHSNLPPHTLESQKKDTNGFIAIQESFSILPIFLKMLHSKVMA